MEIFYHATVLGVCALAFLLLVAARFSERRTPLTLYVAFAMYIFGVGAITMLRLLAHIVVYGVFS